MARIRTIKPEFFRHEGLQDLEAANPGASVMLVFAGLWGLCDNQGVFEYRPRQIKLDILPFLSFDMTATLGLLIGAGYINLYEAEGKIYGLVPSFNTHQRINGKEAGDEGKRYPDPKLYVNSQGSNVEATGKQQGSTREALGKQQGIQESTPSKTTDNWGSNGEAIEISGVNLEFSGESQGSNREATPRPGKGKERKGKGREYSDAETSATVPAEPGAGKPPQVKDTDDPLYRAIWESFLGKAGRFTNYPKEVQATKRLVQLFRDLHPDAPEEAARLTLEKFLQLTEGRDTFWSKQPFTPSVLSSSGIFDRVQLEMKGTDLSADWVDEVLGAGA